MDYERDILNRLLSKLENRESDRQRVFLRLTKHEYALYDECDAAGKLEIHAAVEYLRNVGLIGRKWVRHEENNVLEKIWLEPDRIQDAYRHAGRVPKDEITAAIDAQITACVADLKKTWLRSALEQDKVVYREGEGISGFLEMIRAIDKIQEDTTITQRMFSAQFLGDSKAFERKYRSKLLRIVKKAFCDEDGLEEDQLLERVGITRNPVLIEFCGIVTISIGGISIDFSAMASGSAIISTDVQRIEEIDLHALNRIISIENRTSYYEYIANEKACDEIVLYSAGFLSPERKQFYKTIGNSKKPFVHWGDIDLGGFAIFLQIKDVVPQLYPFRMDCDTLDAHIVDAIECDDAYLRKLGKVCRQPEYIQFTEILNSMLEKRVRLEQESIQGEMGGLCALVQQHPPSRHAGYLSPAEFKTNTLYFLSDLGFTIQNSQFGVRREIHMKKTIRIAPSIKKPKSCRMDDKSTKIQNPYGLPGFKKFTKENTQIHVCDEEGNIYCLAVTYSVQGKNVVWTAQEEIKEDPYGGYEFTISANTCEDQLYAYNRLVSKVKSGVRKKTLKITEGRADNSLKRNDIQYQIKEKGRVRIASMGDGKYGFIIDGILVCPDEFALILSMYEGSDMLFSIIDSCD